LALGAYLAAAAVQNEADVSFEVILFWFINKTRTGSLLGAIEQFV
jgi:hypothetical protein